MQQLSLLQQPTVEMLVMLMKTEADRVSRDGVTQTKSAPASVAGSRDIPPPHPRAGTLRLARRTGEIGKIATRASVSVSVSVGSVSVGGWVLSEH